MPVATVFESPMFAFLETFKICPHNKMVP